MTLSFRHIFSTRLISLSAITFAATAPHITNAADVSQAKDPYFTEAKANLVQKLAQAPNTKPAKNIILFIGDGMGVSTVTATRIMAGQLRGKTGEEHSLSWESFPYTALSKTYNTNQQIADSAGTASAFLTGAKTKAGVISVDQTVPRGDCKAAQGHPLETILELSEQAGFNTGIISTAKLTHATPAAAYAHSPERGWEYDARIPESEKAHGCTDIALQFLDFNIGNGIDLAFGGGRQSFLPASVTDQQGEKGKREDGRNLISEWKNRYKDGQYIWNKQGLNQLDVSSDGPVLGLFNSTHMAYEADREDGKAEEPSLADMTEKALQILQKKDGGYFLFIEAGRIDHAHHQGNAYRALHDGIALDQAVEMAKRMTNNDDTLIIVTADHSHGFVMAGFPTRGNPILGKSIENDATGAAKEHPELALDNSPYTAVGYYNGLGAEKHKPRADLTDIDTTDKDFIQPAAIPLEYESHGGEDVAIYADGPGAYLFQGVVEQNYIFHVMHHAFRLGDTKK